MLALLVALSGPPAPPPPIWWSGRVVTLAHVHVGIRVHAHLDPGEADLAFTFQVTTRVL